MGKVAYQSKQALPLHLKHETGLVLRAQWQDLAKHAYDDNSGGKVQDLFATLIYNYLGKLCLDDHGQIIQITLDLIQQEVHRLYSDNTIELKLDVDKILAEKAGDLFKEERAFTKAIRFDGTETLTEQELYFFLDQIHNPESGRKKHPLPDGVYTAFSVYKFDHRTGQSELSTVDKDTRTRDKIGAAHTTKTPGSLSPTEPKHMQFYQNYPLILVFDWAECFDDHDKYTFRANAGTNANLHYSNSNLRNQIPSSAQFYSSSEAIRQQNRAAVSTKNTIPFNEIRAGLPKQGLKAIMTKEDTQQHRLFALEAMYLTKERLGLSHDLPIKINSKSDLKAYSHASRIEDALAAFWHEIKPDLFKKIVDSSFHKIENQQDKQNLQAQLRPFYQERTWLLPIDPQYENVRPKKYKHLISSNSIWETGFPIVGMLTIIPMVGYGTYAMLDDAIATSDSDLAAFGKLLGVLVLATLIAPALLYGYYSAIKFVAEDSEEKFDISLTN